MPLFRALDVHGGAKARPRQRRMRNREWKEKTDEDGSVLSLTRLCLLNLADNMKYIWAKDYADNYLDHYSFRYIMGPFNLLPSELVEELTCLLCTRKELSRPALHLLLVPQLRNLSLARCPSLVTSALCAHIAARCQSLWSLDLSEAQQLTSKTLCETLHNLPALRSLCLTGMLCDRCVIKTIAHCCRLLRHLDVSHCHLLSPGALLPLGLGPFCSSSGSSLCCTSSLKSSVSPSCSDLPSSSSPTLSPLPLNSLLALDIGFGEQEGDSVAAAAYLLLSLPCLERAALDGLGQACCLIERREFGQADEFTNRESVPRLEEVWRERRHKEGGDSWRKTRERVAVDREDDDEEEERMLWEGYGREHEEDASTNKGPYSSQNQAEDIVLSRSGLILRLRNVKGLTCDSLDSLCCLCPDISSLSVNITDNYENTVGRNQGSLLAAGLQTWSGQLQSLSVHFPGPLVELLPALQVAGSSLVSLTLEGVKTSTHTPLLDVIRACPRLRELLISAEPPTPWEEEDQEEHRDDRDLPRLPNLCSLTLNFSYEHNQMKPVMSWMSLKRVLRCLLAGSPLLEKLSLVSLPCPLDCVLQDVLQMVNLDVHRFGKFISLSSMPLRQLQHVDLPRTDVKMITLNCIMQQNKRLKSVDVSYCWQISQLEWMNSKMLSKVKVVWV